MKEESKKDSLINIVVDRDSVSMGDDIEAHKKIIEVKIATEPIIFIKRVLGRYTIPTIAGIGHSWDCLLNDTIIVCIKGNNIKFEKKVEKINFCKNNIIFFKYNSAIY